MIVKPIPVKCVTASQTLSHASGQRSVSRLECYGAIVFDPESGESLEFAGITNPGCCRPFGSGKCSYDRGYARTDSGDHAG